ncbi:MAG: hypothetical protein ACFFDH_19870 [Promethearchaeota archaeon]
MIEVFNSHNKKIGFIENKEFFNKKHKLIGYLDGNIIKSKFGNPILRLDNHNDIFIDNEQIGFIYNSKVFFREHPVFEILKAKRKICTTDKKKILSLTGNHEIIDMIDLLALATLFLKSNWLDAMNRY